MKFDLTFIALVFGIVFLMVLLTRKAIKKVKKDQADLASGKVKRPVQTERPIMTEEQFNRSWKSLGYLLFLAAAGNLYMTYTAVRTAISQTGLWFFWIDAAFSLAAAVTAIILWRQRRKIFVFIYAFFTLIPILMFMSLKGPGFKENALVHLFPLVLLYFVLQPIWNRMED